MQCGVPQGSVLGPLFFSSYMLYFSEVQSSRCYADDSKFYFPVGIDKNCSSENALNGFRDIKHWLENNVLQLNESKTEVLGLVSS